MIKTKLSLINQKYLPKKNDSVTSPVPELLTQNALKRKLCDSPKNDSPSNILDLGQSKPVKSKLCVTTCKNDFGLSNILDPAQSKAVKKEFLTLLKTQRNLYFTVVLVKIFLRTNLKYIQAIVWLVIYVVYGFTKNLLGFQEKKKNNDDAWLCSTCEKLDTTLK